LKIDEANLKLLQRLKIDFQFY